MVVTGIVVVSTFGNGLVGKSSTSGNGVVLASVDGNSGASGRINSGVSSLLLIISELGRTESLSTSCDDGTEGTLNSGCSGRRYCCCGVFSNLGNGNIAIGNSVS